MAVLEKPVVSYDPFADRLGTGPAAPGTFVATIEDIVDEMGVERRKYQSEETEIADLTCYLVPFSGWRWEGASHQLPKDENLGA
ncbi:MAG: hypothetical protein JJU29_17840 [Verrucomicrobia bacterium]|nr:hypothetical protein [Verrucomicrobiota bacterium]MCH8513878.1 hypothetical protein [Kiritimatiellia bacterium]